MSTLMFVQLIHTNPGWSGLPNPCPRGQRKHGLGC
jgi:hypothetical protein